MIWMAESLALVLWCCPVEGSLEKTPNNKIVIKSNIYFIYLWESFLNLYLHLASHVVYTTCLLSETKYFCKVRDSSYFFLIETGAVRGEGVLKFCTPPLFWNFKVKWRENCCNGDLRYIFILKVNYSPWDLYMIEMISLSYDILDLCQYRGGFICKMLSILFVCRPVHLVNMYWWNLRLKKKNALWIGKKL